MAFRSRVFLVVLTMAFSSAFGAPTADPIRWRSLHEPGNGGWIVSLAPSPHDPRRLLAGGDMLGLARSTDRGESWTPTFGFGSYEMCDLTWHPSEPDIVWTGSLMGPYRSSDGGITWSERRRGMPEVRTWQYSQSIETILFDPGQPRRLLAFGGTYREWGNAGELGAVWESLDDGDSWKRLAKLTARGPATDLNAAGANITSARFAGGSKTRIYAVAAGIVFVSEDAGRSWQRRDSGLPDAPKSRLAVHPTDPDVALIGCAGWKVGGEPLYRAGGVYRTRDGGKTWVRLTRGLEARRGDQPDQTSRYVALAVSPKNPAVVWTCDGAYSSGVIYKSEDGGDSWRAVATRGNPGPAGSTPFRVVTATFAGLSLTGLVADPRDADTAYAFGSEYILRTGDGGKTWTDLSSVSTDPADARWWRGRGWTGWCSQKVAFNPYRKGQLILQAMDAGRGWLSDDGGRSFRYLSSEPNPWCGGKDVTFTRDGRMYLTTGQFGGTGGILCVRDFGRTVQVAIGKKHGLPEQSWGGANAEGAGVYAHPEKSQLARAVLGGRLYQTDDGGARWRVIASRGFQHLAGDPAHPDRFYVTGKDGVYVTHDGQTFHNLGGPRPATRGRVSVDARGRVYVCAFRDGRPGLWRYLPASNEWQRLLDEPLAHACVSDPSDPDCLLLVTSQDPYHDRAAANGVWISADGGSSWSRANQDLPMLRVNTAAFDPFNPESIVVGTYGMGFYRATWPKTYRPAGPRRYRSTDEDRAHARKPDPAPAGRLHVVRDFGPKGFDYLYGPTWKDTAVRSGTDHVEIDATEAGGGGIVLHGADLAPDDQTHFVLRLTLLPGNAARRLALNVVASGQARMVFFDLPEKPGDSVTLTTAIGDLDVSRVEQIQLAGTNFGSGAARLRLRLDSLGTLKPKPR